MRIPDDKFNISIPNADQADASQSVDALPAESETATAMPASADSVEQFSPPTSDLPQLDEPNFPVGELTGTATPSAIPVVDSGRQEIAHPSEIREGNPLNPYLSLFESSATIDPVLIPGDGSVAPGGTAFPDKFISVDPQQTLPVNPQIESMNLPGLENLKTSPDHFGIDMKGTEIRNQLNDALNLRGNSESSAPSVETKGVNVFDRPGMSRVADGGVKEFLDGVANWFKSLFTKDGAVDTGTDMVLDKFGPSAGGGEAIDLLRAPSLIEKVTGDATDGLRGVDAAANPEKRLDKIFDGSKEEGTEYVDPEGGPAGTTQVPNFTAEEAARFVASRKSVNTTPSNVDDEQPISIDPSRVYDPMMKPLVTDGNPEFSDSVIFTGEGLTIRQGADGGDPVNPNDPDVAQPDKPTTLPPK